MEFIDEKYINELINDKSLNDNDLHHLIIQKAKLGKGINLRECAALLNISDSKILQKLFSTAKELKENIYGNRLVMFAPLYLTNACVNNCLYCAFRVDNKELVRKTLSIDDVEQEARQLIMDGHKRLLLVCGEHPKEANLSLLQIYHQPHSTLQHGHLYHILLYCRLLCLGHHLVS